MLRRTLIRAGFVGAVGLTLAACTGEAPVSRTDPPPPAIRPGPDGLRLNATDLRIDFGRAQPGVIAAVTKLRQATPRITHNAECGAGPMTFAEYPAGLTLNFQNGDFVGWTNRSTSIYATNNFGPGATRTELGTSGVTFRQTTLGDEFELQGVYGLIEEPGPLGVITLMWAGTTCFFR